jgi:hypothetical protein
LWAGDEINAECRNFYSKRRPLCLKSLGRSAALRLQRWPGRLAEHASRLLGIYSSSGESPEALAKAKTLGVTNYEEDAKAGGGGAQQKVLVDNDTVRVNLVSFKKGFIRPGGLMRKNDQLLVYLDEGQFTLIKTGNNTPVAKPNSQRLLPGSSVFHSRGSIVSESLIDQDYRVLFIEMKK